MRLENKVAIITGAASGIGRAIADLFLKEGAKVVYADIVSKPEGMILEKGKSLYVKANVSKRKDIEKLIKSTINTFGSLDIMVNNAGIGGVGGILDASPEDFNNTLQVNLFGVFHGVQLAAQFMKENKIKGSIINMSSILGTVGMEQAISYCSSKGGVVQLTRAAAIDLAPYKIRVNAIAPGFIKTKMTKEPLKDKALNKVALKSTPLGYIGKVSDIASSALYLASDEASYVTGTVLHVDGGWTAK